MRIDIVTKRVFVLLLPAAAAAGVAAPTFTLTIAPYEKFAA
jgi:hypothetical protein